jgi:hypothetical protein
MTDYVALWHRDVNERMVAPLKRSGELTAVHETQLRTMGDYTRVDFAVEPADTFEVVENPEDPQHGSLGYPIEFVLGFLDVMMTSDYFPRNIRLRLIRLHRDPDRTTQWSIHCAGRIAAEMVRTSKR